MKILLTGGSGFIGTYLQKEFKKLKIDFVNYDLKNGYDIRDQLQLDKLFEAENFDTVLHLAALAGVRRSEAFPDEYISTNINGTKYLIEACKMWGVKNFIFYSSSSVLGGCHEGMGPGVGFMPLHERDEYSPKGVYAITKVAGEMLVKSSGLRHMIIRPFTVYGPNGRPDMVIYKWINQIHAGKPITFYGDGDTSRGYTYVEDLIDGTIRAISYVRDTRNRCDETYHLGGCERITLKGLLDMFEAEAKKKKIDFKIHTSPMPDGDVCHSLANTARAKNDLGFNPKPRFKKIVKKILEKEL